MIHRPQRGRRAAAAAASAVLIWAAAPAGAATDPGIDLRSATEEEAEDRTVPEPKPVPVHWTGGELADHRVLTLTNTESGVDLLTLLCHRPTGVLTLQLRHEPTLVEAGMALPLEIRTEDGQAVPFDARGARFPASDAFIVEVQTTVTPELRRVLTTDPGFEVVVEGRSLAIPLAGAQPGMAALLAGCSGL